MIRPIPALLLWFLAVGGVQASPAQDAGIGRIISIRRTTGTGTEVELHVVKGALYNGSDVELFSGKSTVTATLRLSSGIDMLLEGDKVVVVLTTTGGRPIAGALLAERGKFPSEAAIVKAAGTIGTLNTAASAQAVATPPRTVSAERICPFSSTELSRALGLQFATGKPGAVNSMPGGASFDCRYAGVGAGTPSLSVDQIMMDDPAQTRGYLNTLAGTLRKIPGDADGAVLQEGQRELTGATLHYVRRATIVQLRVTVRPSDARFADLQQRLVRLRRVP